MAAIVTDAPATPEVEREIVRDMMRRAAVVAPVLLLVAAIGWGVEGALSAAYALAIVLVNFGLSAAILSRASRMSPTALMGSVLGGFAARMALVVVAIMLVRDASWMSKLPLAGTLLITHLGLLVWEARHLSISLAFPALKPRGE